MRRLHETLEKSYSTRPLCTALIATDGTPWTYQGFVGEVNRLAEMLRDLGVRPGDRVAIYLPKHLIACALPYAASLLGAVYVPVSPALKASQVAHVLHDAGTTALITSPERVAGLADTLDELRSLRHVLLTSATDVLDGRAVNVVVLDRQAAASAGAMPGAVDDGGELAALLYTSGSTGFSKGVMVTHGNLLAGCRSVASYLELVPDDVLLAALPFSFDYGLNQLLSAVYVGASCVLHDFFLPRDVLDTLTRYGVTGLAGVPTFWAQIVGAAAPEAAWPGLRYFTNSGGTLPSRVLTDLRRIFPRAAPYLMYGLTEAFRSTYLPPQLIDERPGSIGKAVPEAEILVMKDDVTPAAPGEEGELVHCGPLVSLGYWHAPQATAQRFRPMPGRTGADGRREVAVWSGDIVRSDGDGFLYFIGRRDGLIKTSGYRVSPDEVEEVAYAVAGVQEACAFGVADELLGQRIVLVVTEAAGSALDSTALEMACRRKLPAYMMPSEILLMPVLPKNANDKPDRPALARAHAAGTLSGYAIGSAAR